MSLIAATASINQLRIFAITSHLDPTWCTPSESGMGEREGVCLRNMSENEGVDGFDDGIRNEVLLSCSSGCAGGPRFRLGVYEYSLRESDELHPPTTYGFGRSGYCDGEQFSECFQLFQRYN